MMTVVVVVVEVVVVEDGRLVDVLLADVVDVET